MNRFQTSEDNQATKKKEKNGIFRHVIFAWVCA